MSNVKVYDFIPGGTVLDYLARPGFEYDPPHVVALAREGDLELSLEITGELKVCRCGEVYTRCLPPDAAADVECGEVEPSLFPWFALRLSTGTWADDLWVGDQLPDSEGLLVGWLEAVWECALRRSREEVCG